MASQSNYEVRPSDLDQAFVRVIFVSAVVVWSYINAPASTPLEALNYKYFNLAFAYWTFSLLAYAWTYFFLLRVSPDSKALLFTRAVSIFADIGAISAYTAISDSFGVILFPIYLNSIIGYGYRFGVKYLYFTLGVAASFFSIALLHNEYLRASRELVIAYYLGMALVPLYSAALLKKHREVLERIRDLNDARSRFIANMSHELRTPLHAIISVSDVLKETLDDARGHVESRHQKMQMVSDSAQHLLGLVNKILDVASADAGKVPTRQREWINVVSVVQTALRICQPKAQQQGVEFYWFFDSRIPTWIRSSGEYLQEILINTVGNAVKYTKEGHVSVRVTYSEHQRTPAMAMDIVDTGIGISPKLLPNIFEPFTLGDDSAARRYAGTGLGLTLTKQYVELLGGEISFQSVENIGTHCHLLIPIEESREKIAGWPADTMRQCVYLGAGPLSATDQVAFSESGWDCVQVSTNALSDFDGWGGRVVFIDSDLANYREIIHSKLGLDTRPRLKIYYGEPEPSAVEHPLFNSSVARGSVRELGRIHSLESASLPYLEEEPVRVTRAAQPIHVLLADDNPTNLTTARMALESAGHYVTCVSSGEEALAALERTEFGLGFIDMHMPGMSGIEVVQIYQFVSNGVGTPVVILTADATTEARDAAEACGAVAYLTKPLRAREFREAVASYARGGKASPVDAESVSDEESSDVIVDYSEIDELLEIGVDTSELLDMVLEFEADSDKLISKSIQFCNEGDIIGFKDSMHALKGASATLGARRLSALAHEYERASSDSDAFNVQTSDSMRDVLAESLRLLRDRIELYVASR
ncbi:MAG: response regulator [Proteobacteria bacterium]|nr:response regulator [Pseudomonadota bacterium]